MKTLFIILAVLVLASCERHAQVASKNLSKASEMFEIDRRIVFYNSILDVYLLVIEGRCSIDEQGRQLEVTCKIADNAYKKHFLHISDNVTYFAEQLDTHNVSVYHHKIIFKPESILRDIDLHTKGSDAP